MESVQVISRDLRKSLRELYGARIVECRVFGSYARGDADDESDLDILIVLDRIDHYAAEVDRTSKFTGDLSIKYGVSISRIFLSEAEWRDGDSPFVLNLREEAIPV